MQLHNKTNTDISYTALQRVTMPRMHQQNCDTKKKNLIFM